MARCPNCGHTSSAEARFCARCGASLLRDPQGALMSGTVLEKRYKIEKVLGTGGFSIVYLAQDSRLNVPVAIKEMTDTSPGAARQFRLEAQLLAQLDHPQLVKVTDHFADPSGILFLVMSFVPGETLEETLDHTGGPLPEPQVMDWALQLCDVLHYMHTWVNPANKQVTPIIHRDIKTDNIKLRPDGKVVIIDLGIAKMKQAGRYTTVAARAVSPGYSPPEQYGKGTDERSDIYSLGATLYDLLTGQPPPDAVDLITGAERLTAPRTLSPALSPWMESVILKALDINILARFQNVAEMRQALLDKQVVRPQSQLRPLSTPYPTRTRRKDGAVMVRVPGGSFPMGSERAFSGDERPQHAVYLGSFWIDVYPVTNAQYGMFLEWIKRTRDHSLCHPDEREDKDHTPRRWKDKDIYDPDKPVVGVDWYDAYAYAAWAGARLPTEAEWEKAARGTDGRLYPWGNDWDEARLNSKGQGLNGPSVVGSYPDGASPYGALDMLGNVWEWVADWYDPGYYSRSPQRSPAGPNAGEAKVLRGGSWSDPRNNINCVRRYGDNPLYGLDNVGFRCVKS